MNVLIVEDERALADALEHIVRHAGYSADAVYNGNDALAYALGAAYDVIVLDVMLPDMDGFQIVSTLRARGNHTPVLMLTARGAIADKVAGLNAGADDYMTKPFNILELKARVRALLRRAGMSSNQQEKAESSEQLTAGHIMLDLAQRVAIKSGAAVDLTVKEFDLLELLMRNPGRVYSRENLLDLVWGYEYQGDYRTVDVHIRRLREKLELDPANPKLILTKWGVGYYLRQE